MQDHNAKAFKVREKSKHQAEYDEYFKGMKRKEQYRMKRKYFFALTLPDLTDDEVLRIVKEAKLIRMQAGTVALQPFEHK